MACGQERWLTAGTVTGPQQLFWQRLTIQCLMFSHRFLREILILMKHWVSWLRAWGNTEARLCVCSVLPLPLPLRLCACLCHRAAIRPSVLAENQVLNALWLGFQLIPCSPASIALRGQFMPKRAPLKCQGYWLWSVQVQFETWKQGLTMIWASTESTQQYFALHLHFAFRNY